MRRNILLLSLLSTLLFFSACQKEFSLELSDTVSSGSLQSDVAGECLPKTVEGIYEVGTVLNATTNYIDVQVNVANVGTYRVYSDTVNGTFFEAKGTFATTGLNNVRLLGNGTPLNAGIQNFVISYDTTECAVAVTVLPQGGAVDAEYTFAGAPNECMAHVLVGEYVAGTPLTPANTVTIKVNVTKAGTYTIATSESNGIIFSGSGAFANTGDDQTVLLTASGTPGVASTITIPVTFGTSTCSFDVEVIATPNPVTDYFPLTAASNWSYQSDGDPNDSAFVRARSGTVTLGGNSYTEFEGTDNVVQGYTVIGNHRKSGGDYYSYDDMGEYFGLDNAVNMDYIFLKDNVPAGTKWQTASINGTITDNSTGTPVVIPISVRIEFTIEQKDVTITVGGTPYANTIVVVENYQVLNGTTWQSVTELLGYYKSYYTRGVGLIKLDTYEPDGTPNPSITSQFDIRRYQVF